MALSLGCKRERDTSQQRDGEPEWEVETLAGPPTALFLFAARPP